MYQRYFKRLMDVIFAMLLILLLIPVYLIVSGILYFVNDGLIFYLQERPGLDTKPFNIIKFKSMSDKRDIHGNLLPDIQRITRFGKFIRKYSIDELPQLFNVLNGDMSLVGPRPLLFKYLPLYNHNQMKRHKVRPGITGLAQTMGRNSISWTKKFEYDTYYVENVSLKMDFIILFKTVVKVIRKEGINQSDERPMMPFNGSN